MKPKITLISLFSLDLGIRYISSFLSSKGYSTDIISFGLLTYSYEMTLNNYITADTFRHKAYSEKDIKLLIEILLQLKPDLIGLNVCSATFITAAFLTKKIKEILSVPIIWGGIHPSICPEECIQIADIVCVGEGEYPMYELAQKLEDKEEVAGINNLWIRMKDGSVERNGLRNLILDLDLLPYPDFDNTILIDNARIVSYPVRSAYTKEAYPIISSRGCHYGCSYCCNNVLKVIYKNKGPYVRRRSPENVINELMHAKRHMAFFHIKFFDDIFTFDQEWVKRFCKLYIKEISLPFICNVHPNYTDKKIIELLAEAGLTGVRLGIQSGSEDFCREKFKRIQSNEEIFEFVDRLKMLNVYVVYDILVDNPYESDADYNATTELLLRFHRPYRTELFSLCYFPKTEFTNQALGDGFITEEDIETKTMKGLNNFFMSLSLVKNKKNLFWDIIIAMVVSDLFPEKLIKKCKRSKLFRQHPKILLTLIRLYLKISLIPPTLIFNVIFNRQKYYNQINKLFKKTPRIFLIFLELYQRIIFWEHKSCAFIKFNLIKNYFDRILVRGHNYVLKDEAGIQLFVLSADHTDRVKKSFHLQILQPLENHQPMPIKLRVCIFHLSTYPIRNLYHKSSLIACWDMHFNIASNDTDMKIEINLLSGLLFFIYKGIRREAQCVKVIKNIANNVSYIAYFFLYDQSRKTYILKNCGIIYPECQNNLTE